MTIDPLTAGEPGPLQSSTVSAYKSVRARNSFRNFSDRYGNEDLSNIEMPSHWAVPWSDLMMVMMVMKMMIMPGCHLV